jgi:nucleotide-binding universal stress UspA family protein
MTGEDSLVAKPFVAVGVSARTGSPLALRWAVDLAAKLDGQVRAVMAWRLPRPPAAPPGVHPPAVSGVSAEQAERDAKQRLAQYVAAAVGDARQVEQVVMRGGPVGVLLKVAAEVDLLVVDSPRPARLATMSAKLVAPRLVYRCPCPVVVMPALAAGEGGGAVAELRRATSRFAAALATSAGTAGRAGLPPSIRGERS